MAQELGENNRNDDVEDDGKEEGLPRDPNRRKAQEQAHDGGKSEDHNRVIQGDLGKGEVGVAAGQPAPNKDHGGAGGGGEQDQPRNVTVQLLGW